MGGGKEERMARLRRLLEPLRENAIKELRGDTSARQLALKSGITPAQMSRIESGESPLTSGEKGTAKKLADALSDLTGEDITPEQLEVIHVMGALKQAVRLADGPDALDAETLLHLVLYLGDRLPASKAANELLDTLVDIARQQLDELRADIAQAEVATKTAKDDPFGLGKPYPFYSEPW